MFIKLNETTEKIILKLKLKFMKHKKKHAFFFDRNKKLIVKNV